MNNHIGIIGLGYVGLPLAKRAHDAGFVVNGIDNNRDLLAKISNQELHFEKLTSDLKSLKNLNILVVCLPTPISKEKIPELSSLNIILKKIGSMLQEGQLIIIESTVYPGYCQNTALTILEQESGLRAGLGFYLAHCPERINPGDNKWNVSNIPRVLGGINAKSAMLAKEFYSKITSGDIHIVSNIAEAEASKMIENSFRDVNIAFVNEMARSFDGTDVNIYNVLEACATKPFGYMKFTPGMGVGGHCIPVDPYYLINSASDRKFNHRLLKLSREINDGMVDYVITKIHKYMASNNLPLNNVRIGLFGLAYKPDVSDIRESQSLRLFEKLKTLNFNIKAHDPLVKRNNKALDELLDWANVIIIAVAHSLFIDFTSKINSRSNIIMVFDVPNIIDSCQLNKADHLGIGV